MQRSTVENHYVFIADEMGMASVFPELKMRLAEDRPTAITILYHSQNNQFLFRKELDILGWHFPSRLYVSYEANRSDDSPLNQASIEAVINANTIRVIQFILSGNSGFIQHAKEILLFLGIRSADVQEQYFSRL
jgi:ferredoxin-NADP reductase